MKHCDCLGHGCDHCDGSVNDPPKKSRRIQYILSAALLAAGLGGYLVGRKSPQSAAQIGLETIHVTCPSTWSVLDDGNAWRFLCAESRTEVLVLKSTVNGGVTGETEGADAAAWRR